MKPDKVIITITAEKTNVVIFGGKKELSNRTSKMESAGHSKGMEKGDIYDDIPEEYADFAEAVDDIELGIFGIAGELFKLREY